MTRRTSDKPGDYGLGEQEEEEECESTRPLWADLLAVVLGIVVIVGFAVIVGFVE